MGNIVPFSDLDSRGIGAPTAIDIDTGHLFDAKGNPVGKYSVLDSSKHGDRNSACALYAAGYNLSATHAAFKSAGLDEQADKLMLSTQRGSDISNPVHLLDLGTGDVHIPSASPNIALGYSNEAPFADIVSPPVLMPKPSDYFFTFDKNDAFQRAYPSGGSGGAEVGEIAPRLSNTLYTTVERALGGFVSTQLEAAADVPLRILTATTRRVLMAMHIEREIRVQSLLRATSSWNASNFLALSGATIWNGGSSSDPILNLHNRIEKSLGKITGILMALPTWNAFIRNPAVRAFYGFKDGVDAIPDPAQANKALKLPPIFVSEMRYINSSGNPDFIWGGDVVLFRNPPEMPPSTQDDIASSYTFRWNMQGKPQDATMAAGGFIIRQFYDQRRGSMGGTKVVVVHQDAETQTSSFVGGLLTGAYT
jgi:hypothetical protein